jgi:hypothetical protein
MNRRRQEGVILIVMLAIIAMSAAWFTVRRLNSLSSDFTIANRNQNAAVLARAKQALMGYVAHQAAISGEDNPGAFPCPEAPGSFNSSAGTDGRTQTPSCTLPAVGRFPWRTIGSEQFVDAAGEPLWYVVAAGWSKPNPGGNTVINSNCNDPTSGLACWNGQLTVDGVANAAVALIIAPGPAMTLPGGGACAAWAQTRPTVAPPDLRNYLECENATSPADASFVTTGPSGSFNDQVIKIAAAEILPLVEGAVADRMAHEIAPAWKAAYTNAAWGGATVLPFALGFADPTLPASYGPGALRSTQGLLPMSYSETAPNSGAPCVAADPRCQPTFLSFTGGAVNGPSITSSNCAPATVAPTNYSRLDCTFRYSVFLLAPPPASVSFTLQATVAKAGASLRQFNIAVAMTNVDVAGRSATGTLNADGSATILLNGTAPTPAGGGGLLPDLLCGLGGLLGLLFDCYEQSISVPIFVLADHPLVDVNDASYGWLLRNKWHEVSYYAVAPGIAPAGGGACVNAATCLRVTYHPSDGKQRGIIAIGGTRIAGQARPPLGAGDLLEDANAAGTSPFTLRAPALLTGRTFNDHIAVLDSNP